MSVDRLDLLAVYGLDQDAFGPPWRLGFEARKNKSYHHSRRPPGRDTSISL